MLMRRINKKETRLCFSEMVCRLSHLFLSPLVHESPSAAESQYFVPFRIRRSFHGCRPAQASRVYISNRSAHSPRSSVAPNRMSRLARSEAQDALFDYLHCTRGFYFTDAEHISKNSPHFVQALLSRVDNEHDVSQALSRFLRYNPINEFEPFLESLGLVPSELVSLLPRDLMFLSDDQVMLDNFHILCNYGFPRSKIGKIYKEANEIFRDDSTLLASKLRAYEQLGLSTSTVVKLLSCCPSLLIGGISKELVGVLEKLKLLGFENDWIGGFLSGKNTHDWNRVLDTMNFLGEVGYSDTQMAVLFASNPALLFEGSGKKIYAIIARLLKLGLKMSQIYSLFSQHPQILSPKRAKNLLQTTCFLYEIGMATGDIADIIASNIQLLGSHSLRQPKTVMRNLKVDKDSLCQIIKEDPLKLLNLAAKSNISYIKQLSSQNHGKFLEKTSFLLKLGYVENSDEMTKALKLFRGRGDQLQERFDCLVQAGLDCNVAVGMVKHAPSMLNQTKDVIEKKIDCLRNCLGYQLESVAAFPSYLCYDIDRINLRFSMYVWLRERGAAKPMLSLSTILACSDARFIKYFVDIDPEGPAMWEILKKKMLT